MGALPAPPATTRRDGLHLLHQTFSYDKQRSVIRSKAQLKLYEI